MSAIDLLYVLVDPGLTLDNSPVLQSQVLDRIRLQRRAGLRVGVVALKHDEARFRSLIVTPLESLGVPIVAFPDGRLVRNLLRGRHGLRHFVTQHAVRHVYARSIWGAFAYRLAFPASGPRLIYDFRGDLVSESADRGVSALRLQILRTLARIAFSAAHTMLAVSGPAAKLLTSEYGKKDVLVLPSGVDASWFRAAADRRDDMRRRLGVGSADVLLVYAGGLNPYQMIPEMLRIWRALSACPDVRFLLLLAHDQPTAGVRPGLELIDRIPRLVHMSVPRSEIPAYLAAADVGFLLRKEHMLNAVASPVKFGEYLASGLAIATSPGLGDASRVVAEHDLGVLIRPEAKEEAVMACERLIERVRADRDGFRRRAWSAVYQERWDWRAHAEVWRQLLLPRGARSD